MKIDKYEKTGKAKYRLYLDNGEVIDTYDEVILKYELLLKKELNSYLYNKILIETKLFDSYSACIKYISVRIRSIKEIRDYLVKKNIIEEDIEEIITRLIKNKYLDDDYFTKCFINDKLKFTLWGPYKLSYELKKHNISSEIIDKYLSELDDNILRERIDKLINKQLNSKKDKNTLRNKLYNYLFNLGYSNNLIIEELNKYF